MTDETVSAVQLYLLEAQRAYGEQNYGLEGFERALVLLHKLKAVRDSNFAQGESTAAIDSLLDENHKKLFRILPQNGNSEAVDNFDFFAWVKAIESDVRAQDPFMLSFDSGSDDEGERARSGHLESSSTRLEGSTPSKGGSTLLEVLMSNGKIRSRNTEVSRSAERDDRFFCLTTVAWTFAVVGMVVTIGFLSKDFYVAQRNVAIQIERSPASPLELPAVTICGDTPNIPPFSNFPTDEHPGLPLFGITTYTRTNRTDSSFRSQFIYPETLPSTRQSPVEAVVVAENAEHNERYEIGFDSRREMESLKDITNAGSFEDLSEHQSQAFSCFRIGKKKRELLYPFDEREGASLFNPSLRVTVFKSRLFGACRINFLQRDPVLYRAFAKELYLYASQLEERGILDFNGYPKSILNRTAYELGLFNHPIDFYCNVYFFAGFFYPTLNNASISYRYNPDHPRLWEKTGKGPYYSAYTWNSTDPVLVGPDVRSMEQDYFSLNSIRLYAEDPDHALDGVVSPVTGMSLLDMTFSSVYSFKKMNVEGKNTYKISEGLSKSPKAHFKVVDHYELSMDFSTFETERILTLPTMSWPEFLTDVFEFVGLFTGICIFTLIVAPAHSLV